MLSEIIRTDSVKKLGFNKPLNPVVTIIDASKLAYREQNIFVS